MHPNLVDPHPGPDRKAVAEYFFSHPPNTSQIDLEDHREKVRAVISNKVAQVNGPTPMDVGAALGEEDWGEEEEWQEEGVNWVSPDSVCSRCKGFGHFARD